MHELLGFLGVWAFFWGLSWGILWIIGHDRKERDGWTGAGLIALSIILLSLAEIAPSKSDLPPDTIIYEQGACQDV